jgi:hypothetical protein
MCALAAAEWRIIRCSCIGGAAIITDKKNDRITFQSFCSEFLLYLSYCII